MVDYSKLDIQKIVVFGGTGAQGSPVVRDLVKTGKFIVTVPTRNTTGAKAVEFANVLGVRVIEADYESEEGLRVAFAGQDACYFNVNSFSIGEPQEYFWTFRAYEVAVQSNLKWFVLAGGPDRLKQHGYEEKYRNAHGTVRAKLSNWLSHQPLEILPWTILNGGVYAQMLSSLLQPSQRSDGVYEFCAPIGEGSIPFVDLDDYGVRTRYVFEHPDECIGKTISWGAWYTTYPELAKAFQNTTGHEAIFRDISQDEWFERISAYVNPAQKMPQGVDPNDKTAFTFRRTFGAWWNLWHDIVRDPAQEKRNREWSDKVLPNRIQNIEGWMKKTNYAGAFAEVIKAKLEFSEPKA